jgi:membrane dipeptidase
VVSLERLANKVAKHPLPTVSREAEDVHASAWVADLHCDFLMWRRDLLDRSSRGHVDLPRLVDGGVSLQVFAAATNMPLGPTPFDRKSEAWPDYFTLHALIHRWPWATVRSQRQRALYMAGRLHEAAARSAGRLVMISNLDGLEAVVAARTAQRPVVGGLLALEGAHALEGDLANLGILHDAGFRMIGLTHFVDNPFAGSANGMERYGLTPLGRELLREMEQLGIVADLAHASPRTIDDVLQATAQPVLVSHTGIQATCGKSRNLSDDQIRAIAQSGGVIGISFGKILICGDRIEDIVHSIGHVADLVGDEHVALGSDFDGSVTTPFDASGLPALTQALMDAGFKEGSIRRILGENVLTVLKAWLPAP